MGEADFAKQLSIACLTIGDCSMVRLNNNWYLKNVLKKRRIYELKKNI